MNAFYILKLHIALLENMHLIMVKKIKDGKLLTGITFQD